MCTESAKRMFLLFVALTTQSAEVESRSRSHTLQPVCRLKVSLRSVYLICLSVCLSVCLSIWLSIYICLSACVSIRPVSDIVSDIFLGAEFFILEFPSRIYSSCSLICWSIGRVEAFRPEGRGFESRSSRHVGTLGMSLTCSCLWRFGVKLRPAQYLCCVWSASE